VLLPGHDQLTEWGGAERNSGGHLDVVSRFRLSGRAGPRTMKRGDPGPSVPACGSVNRLRAGKGTELGTLKPYGGRRPVWCDDEARSA
jgi:hypothetical protein